jgi:hypothetical protein
VNFKRIAPPDREWRIAHVGSLLDASIAEARSSAEPVESGEWRVESEEWRVESGEWRVKSSEWRVQSGEGRG